MDSQLCASIIVMPTHKEELLEETVKLNFTLIGEKKPRGNELSDLTRSRPKTGVPTAEHPPGFSHQLEGGATAALRFPPTWQICRRSCRFPPSPRDTPVRRNEVFVWRSRSVFPAVSRLISHRELKYGA